MKYLFIVILSTLNLAAALPIHSVVNSEDGIIYVFLFLFFVISAAYSLYLYRKRHPVKISRQKTGIQNTQTSPSAQEQEKEKALLNYLKESHIAPEIHQELFRINNLLKELYNLLEEEVERHETEFLYEIDKTVPIELMGDVVLLKQIFFHILSSLLRTHKVKTLIFSLHQKAESLDYEIRLYEDEIQNNESYDYDLGYAQTLLDSIDGELYSYPWVDNLKRFLIKIPCNSSSQPQPDYYRLPDDIERLQLLFVEEKPHTASVYTRLFRNFGIPVRQIPPKDISVSLESGRYDMILLDIDQYPTLLQHQLARVKEKYGSVVLAFRQSGTRDTPFSRQYAVIDQYLEKPLTPGMIHDFLFKYYGSPAKTIEKDDTPVESYPKDASSRVEREDFKRFGHAHILIVEDNRINQKIIENILAKSDLDVSIANHGEDALEILEHEKTVNLVLMDINMPVMDGYEATRRIRQIKRYKRLPIVVISALGYRNEIEKMYHIGVDAHLSKPFMIDELYEVFKKTLVSEEKEQNDSEKYIENTTILNTTKGLFLQKNILQYRDMLGEMHYRFNDAPEKFKNLLIKEAYPELSCYMEDIREISAQIGADAIKDLVSEIKVLSDNREEALLKSYLPHFNDLWRDTLQQIKSYLANRG